MEAGPFTDVQLSGLWGTINTTRSLDRRSISSYNQSFGVLGFKKTSKFDTCTSQLNQPVLNYLFKILMNSINAYYANLS